jgi:hypothetical protein
LYADIANTESGGNMKRVLLAIGLVPIAGANPYDGSDDALIGVVNNSSSAFTGTIHLVGSGNGGGLFAFDGDGICTFVAPAYCATAPTGYEGPVNTFANITTTTVFDDTGDVDITGLAAGATTYFSLESSPSSITGGGGIIVTSGAPEPSTVVLFGSSLAGLEFVRRRRRCK